MSKNQSIVSKLDTWHQTLTGYVVFAIVELLLGYLFASLAIDSGSYWYYGLALVFGLGGIRNLVRAAGLLYNRKK